MKKLLLFLAILQISNIAFSQKNAYVLYNSKGKKVSHKKMIKTLAESDIVLFGEIHNNPISHWLQYEVVEDLSTSKKLILGQR